MSTDMRRLLEFFTANPNDPPPEEKPDDRPTPEARKFVDLINRLLKHPKIKGHVTCNAMPGKGFVFLHSFGAFPRGEGWGAAFLKLVCNEASRQQMPLWLTAGNDKLVKYYERFGFKLMMTGVRKDMLREP